MSACLLCVPVVLWVHKSNTSSNYSPPSISKSKYPAPQQAIKGFRFSSVQNGVHILSIEADHFRIEKKKLGLLRIGLVEEAILHDALFRIYGYQGQPEAQLDLATGRGPPAEAHFNSQNSPPQKEQFVLRNIFSKQAIPSAITSKNLAFISARPILIEVCTPEDKVITRFKAEQGSFNLRKRAIELSGNVQVQSGDRILRTAELAINPALALLKARGDFDFSFPHGQTNGRGLITDMLLQPKRMMHH